MTYIKFEYVDSILSEKIMFVFAYGQNICTHLPMFGSIY